MALLDSEIERIRFELGYPVLTNGAEPYIGISPIFDNVIQPYVSAGASTTSATAVTAASTPTPVTLTLTSASGFSAGCRVVVDVDGRQEFATVQSISGSTIVVHLSNTHSGTYPVTVEGGETIIREILRHLIKLGTVGGLQDQAMSSAGIKKVDEIEFFGDSRTTVSRQLQLERAKTYWRDELASALGLANLRGGSGQAIANY